MNKPSFRVDYDASAESSLRFFTTVQNKMHWATHGHTAAELIALRTDANAPNAGLTTWAGATWFTQRENSLTDRNLVDAQLEMSVFRY